MSEDSRHLCPTGIYKKLPATDSYQKGHCEQKKHRFPINKPYLRIPTDPILRIPADKPTGSRHAITIKT